MRQTVSQRSPEWHQSGPMVHTGPRNRRLPRWYGWVGTHFVTRRFHNWRRSPSLKRTAALIPGLAFDAVVYVIAQARMARGTGAGFW